MLSALERPSDALRHLGPNWFASVMGTGIVANAAVLLSEQVGFQRGVALGFWLLAAALLTVLVAATAAHWVRHPDNARGHASDPAMAPFYGAPAMAFLTVGAGTLLVGKDLIGADAAVTVDGVLWCVGTTLGLATAVGVPYLLFTRHDVALENAFGGWLMPVVPPMVSAATGAALVAHVGGALAPTLLWACYAMFGLSLLASIIVITLIWARLALHGNTPAKQVPTHWIVLGPLGQSITATSLLGAAAAGVIDDSYARAMHAFAVVYGVPVLGFALMWLTIAIAITVRTAREGLPFSLTWWSFTFPVGTCVTGVSELAADTGLPALRWLAVALFALLICGWVAAATNTARGAVRGHLFLPA